MPGRSSKGRETPGGFKVKGTQEDYKIAFIQIKI